MPFVPLEQLNHLYDGYQKAFKVDGVELLLCQMDGKVFLIENRCPHMDVSLTQATLLPDFKLRCRAHGIEFDMNSGKACGPLADTLESLNKYELVYDGTTVGVEL